MNKTLAVTVALCIASICATAQRTAQEGTGRFGMSNEIMRRMIGPVADTIAVWPDGAPNEIAVPQRPDFRGTASNSFDKALIEVYRPLNPNGLCIIMCPGGGYATESQSYEGRDLAAWLNSLGITYCMLQYRLPHGHSDVPLSDAEQAMRIVRRHATEWGIDKVGIMGCSAGGHLAATLATHYSSADTRPDFQILLYPVITMDASFTHQGSRDNLLGRQPSQELVELMSNEKQVTSDTPTAFIALSADDSMVPPKNSIAYFNALNDKGVKAAMFIYPTGDHGWGFKDGFKYKREWTAELEKWLSTALD